MYLIYSIIVPRKNIPFYYIINDVYVIEICNSESRWRKLKKNSIRSFLEPIRVHLYMFFNISFIFGMNHMILLNVTCIRESIFPFCICDKFCVTA